MEGKNRWKRAKRKEVVVYNLSESEKEKDKGYKEDEEACRKIFEEIEIENIEQKQLIRLRNQEENKMRPIPIQLREEETAKEVLQWNWNTQEAVLVREKRLWFLELNSRVFISKDLSREEKKTE